MQAELLQINDIRISPDGRYLAAVSGEELSAKPGTCRIWDIQSGKVEASFQATQGPLHSLAFSPDSQELIAGGGLYSGPSEVWQWTKTTRAESLSWATATPSRPSLGHLMRNSVLRLPPGKIRFVTQVSTLGISNVAALAYSPDGRQVAAAPRLTYYEKDKANGSITIF